MEKRTEVLSTKLTKKEARMIERVAKAEGLTVAAYLRAAGLASLVLNGDMEAMKYFGLMYVQDLAKRAAAMFENVDKVTA